jgi:hypothetical protein
VPAVKQLALGQEEQDRREQADPALQVGNALGVALLGIVFYGALGGGVPQAFRDCLIFLIVLELVLTGLVQLLPKDPAGA